MVGTTVGKIERDGLVVGTGDKGIVGASVGTLVGLNGDFVGLLLSGAFVGVLEVGEAATGAFVGVVEVGVDTTTGAATGAIVG